MPIEFLHIMISKGHNSIPNLCRCDAGGRPRQSLVLAATLVLITPTKNLEYKGRRWVMGFVVMVFHFATEFCNF